MSLGLTTPDTLPAGERLATLPPWPWEPLDPEAPATIGWHVIAWAEGWQGYPWSDGFTGLIQPNGPQAGRKFRFTRDQRAFMLWWYAFDEATTERADKPRWLYSHGVRRLAKGSGKSPFAAVWCLVEFAGPCRLKDLASVGDPSLPGRCLGAQVHMPLVQIAATAESQTKNTMRMVRAFASKKSPITGFYEIDPGKTVYYRQPEATLEVVTSSATAAEGGEASAIVCDETEHFKPSNGGPELAATLKANLAKSGNRMIETANAWVPGLDTVAEDSWEAYILEEEGRTVGKARTLYDARMAPPGTDIEDMDATKAALEFVYDDCDWLKVAPGRAADVESFLTEIYDTRTKLDGSLRKFFNWPSSATDAWVTKQEWSLLVDASKVVSDGDRIAMFFDGSKSSDATALVGCRIDDGHVFLIDMWEPNPKDPDDVVPPVQVDAAVDRAFDRWTVAAFLADVREWESFAQVSWPARHGDTLEIHAVPGGKAASAVAWDMRSHVMDFTLAAELVLAEIYDQGFTHCGDSRLARHVINMRRHPNRWGVSVGKATPDSPLKIDGGICMIGARLARRMVLTDGGKKGKRAGHVVGW